MVAVTVLVVLLEAPIVPDTGGAAVCAGDRGADATTAGTDVGTAADAGTEAGAGAAAVTRGGEDGTVDMGAGFTIEAGVAATLAELILLAPVVSAPILGT